MGINVSWFFGVIATRVLELFSLHAVDCQTWKGFFFFYSKKLFGVVLVSVHCALWYPVLALLLCVVACYRE